MTDIKPFIELLEAHRLTRLEFEEGDLRIELERRPIDGFLQPEWLGAGAGGAASETQAAAATAAAAGAAPPPHIASALHAAGSSAAGGAGAPASYDPHDTVVTAPLVGMAYRSSEPGAAPFVVEGQRVEQGDPLCLIEAMKLFNEIPSPRAGTIKKILFEDGALVDYAAPLIVIG
jgi:acetyl-CoA carboxylase biotin carboxyl carrier protein